MLTLRRYQEDAVASFFAEVDADRLAPLIVLPTGGGKTVIFLAVIDEWLQRHPDQRVVVLAHRNELVTQPERRMQAMFGHAYHCGVISASGRRADYGAQVTFAMKDTLASPKRLQKYLAYGVPGLIITDEAHHAVAATYQKIYNALRAANPAIVHLGVTATPERGDGIGFGGVFTDSPNYKSGACFEKPITEMINEGWLASPKWLVVKTGVSLAGVKATKHDYIQAQLKDVFETDFVIQSVVKNHKEHTPQAKAICFTVSVAGATKLADAFIEAGYSAAAIYGEMEQAERDVILRKFSTGEISIITNCAVLTEGFDEPTIEVCHLVRPTKSIGLYLQMIGRVLRPKGGNKAGEGETAIIFEYAPEKERSLGRIGYLMGLPPEETAKLEKAERGLDEVGKQIDDGDILAGLGYKDGQIEMGGLGIDGLSIVVEEIDYLNRTRLRWHKGDNDYLTLGIKSQNGNKRILVLSPPDANGNRTFYGLFQEHDKAPLKHRVLAELISLDTATDEAERMAQQYGLKTLSSKSADWLSLPATDGQKRFITALTRKRKFDDNLTRGEASSLIDYYQAMQVLFQ